MKTKTLKKLYIDDILKVHYVEKRKTPRVPSYDHDDVCEEDSATYPPDSPSIPSNEFFQGNSHA